MPLVACCLALVFITPGLTCGGSKGTQQTDELAGWVARWSDDAVPGERPPPSLDIPPPPRVPLPSEATLIGDDVARAAPTLAGLRARAWNEETQEATRYTQSTLCEWFAWYVEDPAGRAVPDANTFLGFVVKGALKVQLNTPPEREVQESVELFRAAIERGQSLSADTRNAAIAAACAAPVG